MAAKKRQTQLNHSMPVAAKVKLGDVLADLIAAHNDLKAQYLALVAKLDADAGVTDTNYAATVSPTLGSVADLESRT